MSYDAIVVGLGAHGSAAALALARRGLRVLGLERFERGHGLGSSGGRTRIIRLAYFEDPSYVPLAVASWDAWLALERETGASILTPTGGLYAGLPGSAVLDGAIRSAREHDLPHEVLDTDEIRRRWPIFVPPDGAQALIEEKAGFLAATVAIETQLALAERLGAELRFGVAVGEWRPAPGGGFEVETAVGRVDGAAHLVITAGPGQAPSSRTSASRSRSSGSRALVRAAACRSTTSAWAASRLDPRDRGDGSFYGFPYDPGAGLKVARHHSGVFVSADDVDRTLTAADEARVRAFAKAHMPGANGPLKQFGDLPVHEHARRRLPDRHPSRRTWGRLRIGLLGPRLQVRPGDRRGPRGPGTDRPLEPADRPFPSRAASPRADWLRTLSPILDDIPFEARIRRAVTEGCRGPAGARRAGEAGRS